MKTILVLRHAKSSWDDPNMSDYERPLNERGRSAAPKVGLILKENNLIPELIISSTAKRAKETSELVKKSIHQPVDIYLSRELYDAGFDAYVSALQTLPKNMQTVLIVGHNPNIEMLVQYLTGKSERMPTAALAHIQCNIKNWPVLSNNIKGKLVHLWRPKELD